MIALTCAACHKKLSAKEELAGKKVKCPGCGKAVAVPALVGSPVPSSRSFPADSQDLPTLPPSGPLPPLPAKDQVTPPPGLSDVTKSLDTAAEHDAGLTDFLAPPQADDELGRLGGFRILKVLGHGGMGVVYQGEDPKLGRKVAIKVMLPHLAESKSSQQRFLREARAAAALEHDHIVAIHHVGEDRGAPFIVMPFLKGEPLDGRLRRDDKLPIAEVLRIGREIAEGLGAAHACGLMHRDIKPANIWLEAPKDRVKILDFGLARAAAQEAGLTQQGAIIGTPAYMAPEQGRGDQLDGRCDLWSLGVVLYRLCTGKLPFDGRDTVSTLMAVATTDPKPPVQLNPEVPAGLSDLVMHLLAKDPALRSASADGVVAALRDLEQAQQATQVLARQPLTVPPTKRKTNVVPGTTAGRAPTGGPAPARKSRKLLLLAVGGALVAAAALVIVLFWQTPHGTVRIESDDPNVEVVFDKTGPTVKGADKEPITLRAGEHGLVVKRGDLTFETDKLLLKKGETITLKVDLLQGRLQVTADGRVLGAAELPRVGAAATPQANALPRKFTNNLGMEFALVPRGKAWLGGGGGKPGDKEVEVPYDFYLGVYEVTQEEWQKVVGQNPSSFSRAGGDKEAVKDIPDEELKRFPVENISWKRCRGFVSRLNLRVKERAWVYRLPNDVEWEYACRGGPLPQKADYGFDFYLDKATNQLRPDQANFSHYKGLKRTCKVGSYPPNRLGLYDMHGNVGEWCHDTHAEDDDLHHRSWGGGWRSDAGDCRAACRGVRPPSGQLNGHGLRVARVPAGEEGK